MDIQAKLNEGKGKGYEQWATIFNLKQMAKGLNYLQAKYETELILHKASRAYFDKLGLKKLPTIKSLQTEEQKLYQAKNQAYGRYKKTKQEMQDMLNAKMNVDRILNLKQAEKTHEKTQEAR